MGGRREGGTAGIGDRKEQGDGRTDSGKGDQRDGGMMDRWIDNVSCLT